MNEVSLKDNRTGIEKGHVGFFPENEPIWVITSYLNEKEDIENGLNRNTVRLININDILINAEASLRDGQPCASLIITEHLPVDIESRLSEVVKALNLMPKVKVYEINRDPLFNYAAEIGSIRQLILLSRDKTRSENIKTFDNPDDKQAEIMRSLEADIAILETKLEGLNKEKEVEEQGKLEAIRRLKELVVEVEQRYLPDVNRYKSLAEQLEVNLKDIKVDLEQEQNKTDKYRKEKDEALSKVVDLEYNVKALRNKIDEKDKRIELLEIEVKRKEKEINQVVLDRDKMLSTMVEEEQTIMLANELKAEKKKKDTALGEIDNLRIETREKQYTIIELEREISNLRQGTDNVTATGRTSLLDSQTLNNTDLIYIKVIDNLPYHRLAITMLFDLLNAGKYKDNKGCLIIIKNDEGLDHVKFKGIDIIGDLEGMRYDTNKVKLYPSATMFTGYESFEKDFGFVFVVDYIQSNSYYLDSRARSHFMTMVQASHLVNDIVGLKGSPLSVDRDSIFNLNFDPNIANSGFVENRHATLMNKVTEWYHKLNIVS